MRLLVLTLLSLSLLSSCIAYQSGGMSSSSNGANYVYEDLAFGEARADRFLWFGGLRKDALLLEAKRDLITSRPLKENEEYINFTYDFKNTLIIWFTRTKVSVSADVIKYTPTPPSERYSEMYKDKLFKMSAPDSLYAIGDSVYTEQNMAGIILSNINDARSRILLTNGYGEIITKRMNHNDLYNQRGVWMGKAHGDEIRYHDDMETFLKDGKIIGFGEKKLLILLKSGEYARPLKKNITIIADS